MNAGFMGGLAVSGDGRVLYAAQVYGKAAVAVDLATGAVLARRELPAEAYTTLLAPDGRALYVSVWGGARVAVLDPATLAPLAEIPVRRAPQRHGLLEGRAAPVRGLRQHQRGLGDRPRHTPGGGAHRCRALAQGAPRLDAERARALARRRHAARRERRQQHRRRRRRHAPRREPLPGLHPHRLVPDRASRSTRRRKRAGPVGQGPDAGAQPARPPARLRARGRDLHRRHAERRALDPEAAGRRRAREADRARLRHQRLQRRAGARRPRDGPRARRSPAASASRPRSSTSST